jgi:hypothetical protein
MTKQKIRERGCPFDNSLRGLNASEENRTLIWHKKFTA